MQTRTKQVKLIVVGLITAAVVVGGYFLVTSKKSQGPAEQKQASPIAPKNESLGSEIHTQIENPGEKIPETNPFQKPANPFEETETNPYSGYKNPFQ